MTGVYQRVVMVSTTKRVNNDCSSLIKLDTMFLPVDELTSYS